MYEIIKTIMGVVLIVIIGFFIRRHYKKIIEKIQEELEETKHNLKSAFVKFGKSFEHFIPFSSKFPGDKEKTIFLGMPIDFISFDEDTIKFIECKTGSSQLNKNQKRVKELIETKKVEFIELRY